MNLSKLATSLGKAAVTLRDVNAVVKSVEQGSVEPVGKRVVKKAVGRAVNKGLGGLWRW